VVRDEMKAQGFALAPGAVEEAVARLGSDRGVTRRELEKLALYCHGSKQITAEDVRAVMGDEAQVRGESAFDAAGSGDYVRLDLELERLWAADTNPAQVIRGAMGHFQRLVLAREGVARGEQIDGVMRKFFPPVHFSRADSFKAQARNWNGERLADALDMLLEAEALSRTTAMPAQAVTGRTLLSIAAMAKAR
jgi:DNA polymerase-3 subunit delta